MGTTRLDPNQAKQKWHTDEMKKGCTAVIFYNHTDYVFSDEEKAELNALAMELYDDIGWIPCGGTGGVWQFYVWVDIGNGRTYVGLATSGDGANWGFVYDNGESLENIKKLMKSHASTWREKDNLVHDLSEA